MPRTLALTPALTALLAGQDDVVSLEQLAQHGFSARTVNKRIERGVWRRVLPGVVMTSSGPATRRQRLVAAWLWGGDGAAVDGIDALRWHGLDVPRAQDADVHVVVPWNSAVRSRDFVVVRRAMAEIRISGCGIVPYVDAPTAAIVAARGARSGRDAVALLSRSLQQELVTVGELRAARECIGDKWCRRADGALLAVGVGVRSPAEDDLRHLLSSSRVIPSVNWNQWLDLGDGGGFVCIDALIEDAGIAGEVIGRKYHAWAEQYEDTNARKERVQAAGLVVCEATPTRIRRDGQRLLAAWEQIYLRHAGEGMPAGVRLIPPPGIAR